MPTVTRSANRVLLDLSIRHALLTERFKAGEVRRILRILDREILPDLAARLAGRLENIATRGYDTGPNTTARLQYLYRDLRGFFADLGQRLRVELEPSLTSLAEQQASQLAADIRGQVGRAVSVATPSDGAIRRAVLSRPIRGFKIAERLGARARAARVAVEAQLRIGLAEGETPAAIIRRVRAVWPVERRHVAAAVRTAVGHAQVQARQATYEANSDILAGIQWHATLDVSTCPACFPASTSVVPLGACVGAFRRSYDGDFVVVRTSAGKEFRATPNHPILTARGWRAAQELKPSKDVLYRLSGDGLCVGCREDVGVPAVIGEIADSLFEVPGARVSKKRSAAADFHGDGAFTDGEVEVALAYGDLRLGREAVLRELSPHHTFGLRDPRFRIGGNRQRALARFCVGARSASALTAQRSPVLAQDSVHGSGRDAELGREHLRSHAGVEELEELRLRLGGNLQRLAAPQRRHHAGAFEQRRRGGGGHAVLPCQRCGALAVSVAEDHVVSVRRELSGKCHVFNLSTGTGTYLASGYIVHNCGELDGEVFELDEGPRPPHHAGCRCTTSPILRSALDRGGPGGTRASQDGQVPDKLTWAEWVEDQPPERQNAIFGRGVASLFRAGRIDVGDMVDGAGQVLSLADLTRLAGIP